MKVAIFFDGKNFHAGWRSRGGGVRVDFDRLARWLVDQAGRGELWSATYYTGIETGERADEDGQRKLSAFLDILELVPGFFVRRFARRDVSNTCNDCGAENHYSHEKGVDTSLVADIILTAARGLADVVVLVSGDADLLPAVEGARGLGAKVYVATWGGLGLSQRLRRAAFDHIDLLGGMPSFQDASARDAAPRDATPPTASDEDAAATEATEGDAITEGDAPAPSPAQARDRVIDELARAEEWFDGGYVGLNYFLTRWKSPVMPADPDHRRRLLYELVDEDAVEIYEIDGNMAVRALDTEEDGDSDSDSAPGEVG
jgi:uncharacterized LabA/DUF88 family protein